MPLGEIAGEFLGGALRIAGQLFIDIVVEILIKGPGFVICNGILRRRRVSEGAAAFAGIIFWCAVGGIVMSFTNSPRVQPNPSLQRTGELQR